MKDTVRLRCGLPSSPLLHCILTVYPTRPCHQQHSTSEHIGWCQISPIKPQTGRETLLSRHTNDMEQHRDNPGLLKYSRVPVTGVQLPHSSADTWIVSVEDDWRCQGNQSNLQIQPDAPRVEMFLCICNSPALIAQDFCSCPSPLPPPPDLPSPWCVCRGEVSCHSSCLPEAVSVPSVPWVLQILLQLREELSEIIGCVMRNSLCSHRGGLPEYTQQTQLHKQTSLAKYF